MTNSQEWLPRNPRKFAVLFQIVVFLLLVLVGHLSLTDALLLTTLIGVNVFMIMQF